jgi:hypothetical protein
MIVFVTLFFEIYIVAIQWSRSSAGPRFGIITPSIFTGVDMVFYWMLVALGHAMLAANVVLLVLLLRRLAEHGHRRDRFFGFLAWVATAVGAASVLISFPLNYVWMRLLLAPRASPSGLNDLLSMTMPVLMRCLDCAWLITEVLVVVALLQSCSMLKRALAKR